VRGHDSDALERDASLFDMSQDCWTVTYEAEPDPASGPTPQHPDEYRRQRPILLAFDQELSEGRAQSRPSTKYTRSQPSIGGVLPRGAMTVGHPARRGGEYGLPRRPGVR
jgi:hypothetical protein